MPVKIRITKTEIVERLDALDRRIAAIEARIPDRYSVTTSTGTIWGGSGYPGGSFVMHPKPAPDLVTREDIKPLREVIDGLRRALGPQTSVLKTG